MDDLKTFQPGDMIFKQGDAGDSMLMIKDGSVEIFKDTTQGEVLLTVQNPGEVVGMFTFFTGGKRLASARARSHVEGQVISRTAGQDPLAKLPKWVQVVIKEYSMRLEQINEQFAKALQEKQEAQAKIFDAVFISAQMSDCLAELGPYIKKQFDDGREMLFVDEMLTLLERCLGYDRSILQRIFETFKTTGLIKVELEQDHNKEVFTLAGAQRLKWYAEFVRSTRVGKNRRLLHMAVPYKQRRNLFLLRDFVQKSGGDVQKSFKMGLAVLADQFEKILKTPLEQSAIEAGEKLGLIELTRSGKVTNVAFHPTHLVRTLIALNVIRRLRSEPGSEEREEEAS
jgi:CRP-like cAMP-binding protein